MVKSIKIKLRRVCAANIRNISTNTRSISTKLNNKVILETTNTSNYKVVKFAKSIPVRNCIVRLKRFKHQTKDVPKYDISKTLATAQLKDAIREHRDDAQESSCELHSGGFQNIGNNEENVDISNVQISPAKKQNLDRQQATTSSHFLSACHSDFTMKPCRVRVLRCSIIRDIAEKQSEIEDTPPAQLTDLHKNHLVDKSARNSIEHEERVAITPCGERILDTSNIQETCKDKQENCVIPQSVKRFFHRDQPPARTRSSITRHVYEFLSQSEIKDNEKPDPAADIIKNMIATGRACAMIRSKTGKTRARAVRKKVRPIGKRKQCSTRNTVEKQPIIVQEAEQRHLSPICEQQTDLSKDNDDNASVHVEVPVQMPQIAAMANKTIAEGAYSPLARSLMINQTKEQQSMERRLELLHMAKRFISTPLNRKSNTTLDANTTIFSPVLKNSAKGQLAPAATVATRSDTKSPWRVQGETSLPNTFAFGLNTSQLPSYSSDFIRHRHVYLPDEPVCSFSGSIEQNTSSFGNDSNGENVPPAVVVTKASSDAQSVKTIKPINDQGNENVENLVQLPNPRKTLQHRSPLKDINILEVVVLPPWKKNGQFSKTPTRELVHQFQEQELNSNSPRYLSTNNKQPQQQQQPCNLFGFEDFLSEEDEEQLSVHEPSQHVTLHERLHRLKKLRPAQQELPQVSQVPIRHAHDALKAREPRQHNIKEMFCSTMIDKPAMNESVALFSDFEPETTFDEKKPRRTYISEKPKRKRKQRVHVLFMDTDSSENEDDHGSKNNSDQSPKQAVHPHKRTRRDAEHDAKLKQFITSFNQECEEVENFPLIIE
ncbi:protein dalmatian [Drosophila hydei]|uniref:Protein dalmatian n=1 Tax=Drosophila hydei TaxID=7224 RepID=A0A6J1MEU9_DROHY|nr:protein dalmatian [Drosophila hydei]